jgi:hypothetical protein
MITGGAETASRDTLTVVFWAANAGVELHVRIAAPLRGKHEVIAVEATSERNRLRENPLESGTVCPFPLVDCILKRDGVTTISAVRGYSACPLFSRLGHSLMINLQVSLETIREKQIEKRSGR